MTVRSYLMGLPVDPQAAPVSNTYRWATVTTVVPLAIQLDGDSLPLATVPDCLCDPLTLTVNDRVWTQIYGRRVIVHGPQGGGASAPSFGLPNEVISRLNTSGSGSTASASYVNWPSANGGPFDATLIKQRAGSNVVVDARVSGYVTGSGGLITWGVRVDATTDIELAQTYFNQTTLHKQWSGLIVIAGLGVGSHGFRLRVKSAAPTVWYDATDTFGFSIREVQG